MIIDQISRLDRYRPLHPLIGAIEAFLREPWQQIAPGRYPLRGEELIAIIEDSQGKGREKAQLEAHQRYIDLQMCVEGEDWIGWRPLSRCQQPSRPYDPQRDISFFDDRPELWFPVSAEQFAWLDPEDAHAPLASEGALRKLIFKIATPFSH